MTAAVVRDAAVATLSEEQHLVLESVGSERPAMAEDNRLPLAPVVVVNLRAVFRFEYRHRFNSRREWMDRTFCLTGTCPAVIRYDEEFLNRQAEWQAGASVAALTTDVIGPVSILAAANVALKMDRPPSLKAPRQKSTQLQAE